MTTNNAEIVKDENIYKEIVAALSGLERYITVFPEWDGLRYARLYDLDMLEKAHDYKVYEALQHAGLPAAESLLHINQAVKYLQVRHPEIKHVILPYDVSVTPEMIGEHIAILEQYKTTQEKLTCHIAIPHMPETVAVYLDEQQDRSVTLNILPHTSVAKQMSIQKPPNAAELFFSEVLLDEVKDNQAKSQVSSDTKSETRLQRRQEDYCVLS